MYVVLGASGNVGSEVIRALLPKGPENIIAVVLVSSRGYDTPNRVGSSDQLRDEVGHDGHESPPRSLFNFPPG